jgi:hypothetical protein
MPPAENGSTRRSRRRCVERGRDAGLEPDVIYRLGVMIFAYIDGLSAESAYGWGGAKSGVAG